MKTTESFNEYVDHTAARLKAENVNPVNLLDDTESRMNILDDEVVMARRGLGETAIALGVLKQNHDINEYVDSSLITDKHKKATIDYPAA